MSSHARLKMVGQHDGMAFIVENDPLSVELMTSIIDKSARYLAEWVRPTNSTVERMAQRATVEDVVIIDIILGDQLDGFDVVRTLVDSRFQGGVILVSGYDPAYLVALREIAQEKGLRVLGALKKPFRNEELMSLV
ncbi:MAG: response regulator [Alphaproteobacteria bacterium]|nr:response regulator [Alphaproteobacteria bacterium]